MNPNGRATRQIGTASRPRSKAVTDWFNVAVTVSAAIFMSAALAAAMTLSR